MGTRVLTSFKLELDPLMNTAIWLYAGESLVLGKMIQKVPSPALTDLKFII